MQMNEREGSLRAGASGHAAWHLAVALLVGGPSGGLVLHLAVGADLLFLYFTGLVTGVLVMWVALIQRSGLVRDSVHPDISECEENRALAADARRYVGHCIWASTILAAASVAAALVPSGPRYEYEFILWSMTLSYAFSWHVKAERQMRRVIRVLLVSAKEEAPT